MIDFYGMSSPNVRKVGIMLEELALPFEFLHVNVFAGTQYEPDFWKLNPNRRMAGPRVNELENDQLARLAGRRGRSSTNSDALLASHDGSGNNGLRKLTISSRLSRAIGRT